METNNNNTSRVAITVQATLSTRATSVEAIITVTTCKEASAG